MRIKKLGLLALLVAFCLGCSSANEAQHSVYTLDKQQLELQCDAFLSVLDRGDGPTFELPGHYSGVPASVADYRVHPDSWMYTKEYRQKYGDHYVGPKPDFRGFVPKGTVLSIVGIEKKRSPFGGQHVRVWVSIDDPRHKNVRAELGSLLRDKMGDNPDPIPREGCLRIIEDDTSSRTSPQNWGKPDPSDPKSYVIYFI